jgi:hypothetical protein
VIEATARRRARRPIGGRGVPGALSMGPPRM